MTGFFVVGCLFLAGAIYNLTKREYVEMTGCLFFSAVCFIFHASRKIQQAQQAALFAAQDPAYCDAPGAVPPPMSHAAPYYLTYSFIYFSSKSPGPYRPICHKCRVKAGWPYTFLTLLLGWWSLDGPINTIQTIRQNLKGGIVLENSKTISRV